MKIEQLGRSKRYITVPNAKRDVKSPTSRRIRRATRMLHDVEEIDTLPKKRAYHGTVA